MLVISSREFRQNQKMYLDKVDDGEQIIVQRGNDKSYIVTPVSKDDLYFNAAMVKRIKKSLKEAKKGNVKTITTSDEISEFLGI